MSIINVGGIINVKIMLFFKIITNVNVKWKLHFDMCAILTTIEVKFTLNLI